MADQDEFKPVRDFYNQNYYAQSKVKHGQLTWHDRAIAGRLGDLRGKSVLDVACGLGQWLGLLHGHGASVSGIDISQLAIEQCRRHLPEGEFHIGPAETLPFADASFDLVTCMGSLEHFLDKPAALREMVRVATPDARFLILVPNAGFLTRRLGLYRGTVQTQVREDVFTLEEWESLFQVAGLVVERRWRDLHTLDRDWVAIGRPWTWPLRTLQALAQALPLWPISWQYQVHHYCRRASPPK